MATRKIETKRKKEEDAGQQNVKHAKVMPDNKRKHQGQRNMGNFLIPNKPTYDDPIYTQRETEDFVLFWQKGSHFSQWYQAVFTVDELTFNCAEQFMMYHKTLLCDDKELVQKVLTSTEPEEQKKLGRIAGELPSFKRKLWEEKCIEIVKQGNIAKFSQNPKLKNILLKTHTKTLAEASPFDIKWGIGVAANHKDALIEKNWRGINLLGKILMEVRQELANDSNG